jgi:hypothetical protein
MSIALGSHSHLERRRERLLRLAERAYEEGRDWSPYVLRIRDVIAKHHVVTARLEQARHQRSRPKVSEKAFMQQVRDLARLRGWLCYHTHDSRRSEPGFPDLVLLKPPLLLFVELKRDGEAPTKAQERWLGSLSGVARVSVQVWSPQDWDEVVATLHG